jgi:hypothetical protein
MTEAELEAHITQFMAEGAGIGDLGVELERLGLYDPAVSDGKTLFIADEEVAPESDRSYWNIRDYAKKRGCDAQDVAEGVLHKRREWWKVVAAAQRVYDRNRQQLEAWLKKQKAPWERYATFAEFVLREYAEDFHAGEKTVNLIDGQLKTTKCGGRLLWDGDGAVLAVVKMLRELPADVTDAVLLAEAKRLIVGSVSGYKASELKAGLKKQGDAFYDGNGVKVPWLKKVAPPEATTFKVVQEGVGQAEEETDGETE